MPYTPTHKIRFVTAASLFDGHDVSINIMRRILQASGAEVIHLGHNRSVAEIVNAAVQEDVQGIAISSYQGGHVEYFKYMVDMLKERGAAHIRVFGGGGVTATLGTFDFVPTVGGRAPVGSAAHRDSALIIPVDPDLELAFRVVLNFQITRRRVSAEGCADQQGQCEEVDRGEKWTRHWGLPPCYRRTGERPGLKKV